MRDSLFGGRHLSWWSAVAVAKKRRAKECCVFAHSHRTFPWGTVRSPPPRSPPNWESGKPSLISAHSSDHVMATLTTPAAPAAAPTKPDAAAVAVAALTRALAPGGVDVVEPLAWGW